jgi:hypothetical protein
MGQSKAAGGIRLCLSALPCSLRTDFDDAAWLFHSIEIIWALILFGVALYLRISADRAEAQISAWPGESP